MLMIRVEGGADGDCDEVDSRARPKAMRLSRVMRRIKMIRQIRCLYIMIIHICMRFWELLC